MNYKTRPLGLEHPRLHTVRKLFKLIKMLCNTVSTASLNNLNYAQN